MACVGSASRDTASTPAVPLPAGAQEGPAEDENLPRMPPPSTSTETTYESSNATLLKLALLPVLVEVGLIGLAARAASTLPNAGDPTLRYVSVGIPLFWALLLAIMIGAAFVLLSAQTVTVGARAFVYRRGRYTVIIRWSEAMYRESAVTGGRSFSLSNKTSQVTVLKMLYPQFDRLEAEVASLMRQRDEANRA